MEIPSPDTSLLVSVLLIGLLGSMHCMGMCGGFALVLARTSSKRGPVIRRQALYYTGKTVTYALLGGIAGGMGHALGALFSGFQSVLSLSLGVVLVLIGLGLLGMIRNVETMPFMTAPWQRLSRLLGVQLNTSSPAGAFGLGLVNGLLPCGLVYAALAVGTATGTAIEGALVMSVFGLSTVPALVLAASAGLLLKPAWRLRINQISGIVILVLGLITITRGLPGAHDGHTPSPPHQELPHAL